MTCGQETNRRCNREAAMTPRGLTAAWSCNERNRKNCRNSHGCHCREIADLKQTVADKERVIDIQLRMIVRLEKQTPAGRAALEAAGRDDG